MQKRELPCFPLKMMLLPGEKMQLHIFEPRYRELFVDVSKNEKTFAIPFSEKLNMHQLGSLVTITEVLKQYSDGRVDLEIECIKNFKLEKFFEPWNEKSYPGGEVLILNTIVYELDYDIIELYWKYLQLITNQTIELYKLKKTKLDEVAISLNLTSFEKLSYLNFPPEKKINFIKSRLKYLTLLHNQEANTENNIYLN